MSAFFKSFWRQLGKNTGNCVSNAIFGDNWATPYRVAVEKNRSRRRKSSPENSSRRQNKQSASGLSADPTPSKHRNHRWIYWVAGFILFAGTYNAILYPTKDDVVLIIMLWIVAISYVLFKNHRASK